MKVLSTGQSHSVSLPHFLLVRMETTASEGMSILILNRQKTFQVGPKFCEEQGERRVSDKNDYI